MISDTLCSSDNTEQQEAVTHRGFLGSRAETALTVSGLGHEELPALGVRVRGKASKGTVNKEWGPFSARLGDFVVLKTEFWVA